MKGESVKFHFSTCSLLLKSNTSYGGEIFYNRCYAFPHVFTWGFETWGRTVVSFISYEYELRKRHKFTFLLSKTPEGLGSKAHTLKETFTRTQAVCFCGETKFRRSLLVFCFPLRRPSDLFNKLEEYWLTIKGCTGLEVFSFYPLLFLHFLTAKTVDHTEGMLQFGPLSFFPMLFRQQPKSSEEFKGFPVHIYLYIHVRACVHVCG